MNRTEVVTITNMCMVYDGEKVLVQDRVDPMWGGITFPGGHVEKGEAFTDAVIREVLEETGLTISAPRLCGIKDWVNEDGSRYMVLCYKTDQFSGQLHSSEEGQVSWVKLGQLKTMKLAYDMETMLKLFLDDDVNEFFYERGGEQWRAILK